MRFTDGREKVPKSKRVRSAPLVDEVMVALDGLSQREHFTAPDRQHRWRPPKSRQAAPAVLCRLEARRPPTGQIPRSTPLLRQLGGSEAADFGRAGLPRPRPHRDHYALRPP